MDAATLTSTDVLIIGAGPIGIELAVALKKRGTSYIHLEAGQIGSTISWYAPGTHFFSSPERIAIAGVPFQTLDQTKATREEYLSYLRTVVLQYDLRIETYERVTSIERPRDATFEIRSSGPHGERTWRASKLVLAIGDMHQPRRLGIPGEDLPHVSHYFRDPHMYFRQRVLIVGGKNSAVEAAIRCVRIGAHVSLSYRGAELDPEHIKFWLLPEIKGMIRDDRVAFFPLTTLREVGPGRALLEGVRGPEFELEADFVLLLTGYQQDPHLLLGAGVQLEGEARRPVVNPSTMESNVPGLFIAGTAVAGTQIGAVREFIETSHVHVDRIVAALAGEAPPVDVATSAAPES